MKTKEEIYDELIDPLMRQILEICQDHKISMIASYSVPGANDKDPVNDPMQCTSALLGEEYETPRRMREALYCLMPSQRPATNLRVQHSDGTQELTAII